MQIVNVRVDSRLIHGQVARVWTGQLGAERLMVVGEAVAKDKLEKTALKLARPTQAALSILPPDRASNNIVQGRYGDQKVFIITREPQALVKMVNAGVPIKEVNIGNLSSGSDRLQIFKSVGVSEEDIKAFQELSNLGVKLYHQMVPNDPKEDFMSELNKRMEKE